MKSLILNEAMYTKIERVETAYDLAVRVEIHDPTMIKEDMVFKLDHSKN